MLKNRLDRIEQFSDLHAHPASDPHPYFNHKENKNEEENEKGEENQEEEENHMHNTTACIVFDMTELSRIDARSENTRR